MIESDKTEVKNLLNAATNILEYPSAEGRLLLNNTERNVEKVPMQYFIDRVATHRKVLEEDIFNARLLFLRTLTVTETDVDSLEGFGRTFMPCLEHLCLSIF